MSPKRGSQISRNRTSGEIDRRDQIASLLRRIIDASEVENEAADQDCADPRNEAGEKYIRARDDSPSRRLTLRL